MGRRRNKIGSFMDGFNSTYGTVRGVLRDNELSKIADAQESESTQVNDRAATPDEMARAQAETSAIAEQDAATFAPQDGEAPLPAASDYGMGSKVVTGNKTEFLGKTYDQAPTDIQKRSARSMAQAGILEKFGDPAAGANLRAASMNLDKAELERANGEEMRAALNPAAGGVAGALGTNQAQPGAAPDDNGLDGYLKRVAPKAVQAMLKQGNLEGAKRFSDFSESLDGKAYASAWLSGVRKLAVGDHSGALQSFEKMYNNQLYNDGLTIKLKASEDGIHHEVQQFDQTGKLLGSKTMPTDDLAKHAALALEPTKAVTFMAEQQAKRESESATLERQTQLEALRQKGQDIRDDRRDDRTTRQINAMDGRLSRQLDAKGGLTLPQQRSNSEIDAAREAVSGLSQQDIALRTAKATNTGRDNPNYDPGLAHQAALAGRRKVGADDLFDQRKPQPVGKKATPKEAALAAMAANPQMRGHTLGNQTATGFEIKDSNGAVVGHLKRKAQ